MILLDQISEVIVLTVLTQVIPLGTPESVTQIIYLS